MPSLLRLLPLALLLTVAGCISPIPADLSSTEPDLTTTNLDSNTTTNTTLAETLDTTGTAGAEASMSGTDTSTSVLDTSSSTTGPISFCGDGNLDEDEECDDMNDDPDDGCKLCTRDRFIFVSSAEWQGFALQGLYGADQRCRVLAGLAGLPNALSYRAWLSDSKTADTWWSFFEQGDCGSECALYCIEN